MYAGEKRSVNASSFLPHSDPENYWPDADKLKINNPYEGTPLRVSGKLANHIKSSFGLSVGDLKLRESREVSGIGAQATAQGDVIRFAPGRFRPDTDEGMRLLGHELSHVVTQARGEVRANAPGGFNLDAGHEADSNAAGEAFATGRLSAAQPVSLGGISAHNAPAQGFFGYFKRKLQERRNKKNADKALALTTEYEQHTPEFANKVFGEMENHGIGGVSLLSPGTQKAAYDASGSEEKSGVSYEALSREVRGLPRKQIGAPEQGEYLLHGITPDQMDGLMRGKKEAYLSLMLRANRGGEEFVRYDWPNMSDSELLNNYYKLKAFMRSNVTMTQAVGKSKYDKEFKNDPQYRDEFEQFAKTADLLGGFASLLDNRIFAIRDRYSKPDEAKSSANHVALLQDHYRGVFEDYKARYGR